MMPTSIHFFLDMANSGIWNNTVFLHHEDVEHVIAAAPIDYSTQKMKHLELGHVGWYGMGYPEYTEKYPHTKYTLGFAGQGPTFYINTIDNTKAHGPGGQGHHVLPGDADPCFARVVEGTEVVDELIRVGLNQRRTSSGDSLSWADNEHTWTHLVSASII